MYFREQPSFGSFLPSCCVILILNPQSLHESRPIDHFALLPGDIIVTSDITDSCLRFSRLTQSHPDAEWAMQWLAYLKLPRMVQGSVYERIMLRSHHKSNGSLRPSATTGPQLIFNPVKGLFIIEIMGWDGQSEESFAVIVHSETIMRAAGVFGFPEPLLLSS